MVNYENNQIYELYENCTTENTIVCTNCRHRDIYMDIDPYDAAVEWFAEGWRTTKFGNVYCRICASIKLKNHNQ